MAAGGGEAGMGVMMAGQQAALGKFLAFTRVQEATADAAGAQYLSKAGITGRGRLDFFKKLQNLEFRYAVSQDDDATYGRTDQKSDVQVKRVSVRVDRGGRRRIKKTQTPIKPHKHMNL